MTKTAYKRFRRALKTWMVGCTDLVALTGHTTADLRIYVRSSNEAVPLPSMAMTVLPTTPMLEDVDDGPRVTQVLCEAFSKDAVATLDMAGAIDRYAKQDKTTYADAYFDLNNIVAKGIRSLGVPAQAEPTDDTDSGVYFSSVLLEIAWQDVQETDT
jgi:hypothetical protein